MQAGDSVWESANEACAAAAAAWTTAYELAMEGSDKNLWAVEDAVWSAYVQACAAAAVALQHHHEMIAAARQAGRDEALGKVPQSDSGQSSEPSEQASPNEDPASTVAEIFANRSRIGPVKSGVG